MLGAFLSDRAPLTTAKVRERIQAGAPIYGRSPDRPRDAPRRTPFQSMSSLSPEAYNALASSAFGPRAVLLQRPRQAGGVAPTVSAIQPTGAGYQHDTSGAIYRQAQELLAVWGKAGGPVQPPDFGSQADDLSGTNTPRTEMAVRSFQRWANANGGGLSEDGILDQMTIGQLLIVTADAAEAQRKGSQSLFVSNKWLGIGVVAAALAAIGYSEFVHKGGKGK